MFLFGSAGTGAELLLLEHTEGIWQLTPVALIAAGCALFALLAIRPRAIGVRAFQAAMALFVASGVYGVALHYQGNVEFELELRPGAGGMELFREAMKGATPALAPGTMILLGALGAVYTYRHPAAQQPEAGLPATTGGVR